MSLLQKISLFTISIIVITLFVFGIGLDGELDATEAAEERIHGFNLVAPRNQFPIDSLEVIQAIGANWVAVVPYAFCDPATASVVYGTGRQWWGETPEGITTTIKMAHRLGLKVMLKPHLWVSGQGWAGDLSFETDELWLKWERNYANYLKTYTDVAEREGVELLCIGTEIRMSTKLRGGFWNGLIREVRSNYNGQITYAANWDEFEEVPFWSQLDYIGVDAYFPISNDKTPQVEQLIAAWQKPKEKLKALHKTYNSPVIFTEFGYESIDYNAIGHWNISKDSLLSNYQAQSNAYEAFYQSFLPEDWWAGGFIWKWHLNLTGKRDGVSKTYTPQQKPALDVISRYFQSNQLK